VLVLGSEREILGTIGVSHLVEGRARPDRLLSVGPAIWVSLNRVEADFQTWREGAIAVIRETEDGGLLASETLPIAGLTNCALMSLHGPHVVIACGGSYVGGTPSLPDAGLVRLDEAGLETGRLSAMDARAGGGFGAGLTHRTDGSVLAVVYGDVGGAADKVISWDPDGDIVEEVFVGSGAFRIGGVSVDHAGAALVVDADPAGGRVCRLSDHLCVNPCPVTQLPPRAIQFYEAR